MAFIDPQDTVSKANIEEGMKIADFGCGPGYFTIPLARSVGASGRVYAFDIRKEMLEMVRAKARSENLLNIETIWADLEAPHGSQLGSGLVDRVFVSNILFQIDDKSGLASEVFRILKPKGLAIVVEWQQDGLLSKFLPQQIVDKKEAQAIFISAGFEADKEFYAGEQHYGLIFKKP